MVIDALCVMLGLCSPILLWNYCTTDGIEYENNSQKVTLKVKHKNKVKGQINRFQIVLEARIEEKKTIKCITSTVVCSVHT